MKDSVTIPAANWDAVEQAFQRASASVTRTQAAIAAAPKPAPPKPAREAPPKPAPAPMAGDTDDASFAFTDYGKFYDFLRDDDMLGPTISAGEFEGCDRIIRACAKNLWGISWVAYALGTTYHEVNGTMQPVKEIGGPAYFKRMYDIQGQRPSKAKELGNLKPGDGALFAGRGYVQLTGRTNYAKASKKLAALGMQVDLVAEPDLALDADVAALILVSGMREGWFTGRDIDDDLPAKGPAGLSQFIASRDVINGSDKAQMIAQYAVDFQTALQLGGYRGNG